MALFAQQGAQLVEFAQAPAAALPLGSHLQAQPFITRSQARGLASAAAQHHFDLHTACGFAHAQAQALRHA